MAVWLRVGYLDTNNPFEISTLHHSPVLVSAQFTLLQKASRMFPEYLRYRLVDYEILGNNTVLKMALSFGPVSMAQVLLIKKERMKVDNEMAYRRWTLRTALVMTVLWGSLFASQANAVPITFTYQTTITVL